MNKSCWLSQKDLGWIFSENPGDHVNVMNCTIMEDAPADLEIVDGWERRVSGCRLYHLDMTNLPRPDLSLDTRETGVKPSDDDDLILGSLLTFSKLVQCTC